MTPVIRGTILAESIKPGASFEGHGMRIISWSRYEVSDTAEYQPPAWTAIEFEAPAHSSDALAADLSAALLLPGWYVNWGSDTEATIVFPGRIFRYSRGDKAGREEAQEFGAAVRGARAATRLDRLKSDRRPSVRNLLQIRVSSLKRMTRIDAAMSIWESERFSM